MASMLLTPFAINFITLHSVFVQGKWAWHVIKPEMEMEQNETETACVCVMVDIWAFCEPVK